MKRYLQLVREHNPEKNIVGDCFTTCIASILGVPPIYLPNFARDKDGRILGPDEGTRQDDLAREWLANLGLTLFTLSWEADKISLDSLLNFIGDQTPMMHYILTCKGGRGHLHSVVCRGAEVVHDPMGNIEPEYKAIYHEGADYWFLNFIGYQAWEAEPIRIPQNGEQILGVLNRYCKAEMRAPEPGLNLDAGVVPDL